MTYWYNTNLSYTVCAPKDILVEELVNYLPCEVLYNANSANRMMEWIDLTAEYDTPEFKIGKIQQLSLDGNILPYANVEIHIPNVKLFGKFDVNNFYAIMGKTSNGEPTMDNYEAKMTSSPTSSGGFHSAWY